MKDQNIRSFSPLELRWFKVERTGEDISRFIMLVLFLFGVTTLACLGIAYSTKEKTDLLLKLTLCFWGFFSYYYYITLKKNDGKIL